jgi:hypothetical protein
VVSPYVFSFASLLGLADIDAYRVRKISSPLQSIFMRFFGREREAKEPLSGRFPGFAELFVAF